MRVRVADLRVGDHLIGSNRRVIAVTQLPAGQVRVTTRRGNRDFSGDWNSRTTMTILRQE